jgi:hypothetical protein
MGRRGNTGFGGCAVREDIELLLQIFQAQPDFHLGGKIDQDQAAAALSRSVTGGTQDLNIIKSQATTTSKAQAEGKLKLPVLDRSLNPDIEFLELIKADLQVDESAGSIFFHALQS